MEDKICFEKESEPPGEETEPPGTFGRTAASPAVDFCSISPSPQLQLFYKPHKKHSIKPKPLQGGVPAPVSPRSEEFRRVFYPGSTPEDWNSWHWQLRNRIQDLKTLDRMIRLSENERRAVSMHSGPLPLAVTPYFASLLDPENPLHPLRRTVVPVEDELRRAPQEADDPLNEDADSPVPGLVHRYPDRVLFLVTNFCSTYCRYCTRSRIVGNRNREVSQLRNWERALAYIEANPAVRDVLLSGGDPLTLSNDRLEWLLVRLRQIPHVEFIRIGTKVPVVLPQRITSALTRMLKRYHPLWMSIHFTHPDELTPEVSHACKHLADAGIPLGSQTVLLKGINDDAKVVRSLVHGLLKMRVRPYYLYQCDPIPGSSHFRTSVEKGLEVIRNLRGFTTGYAVPQYVIDAPGGGGKVPLLPDYVLGRKGDDLLLKNYEGSVYLYPDPGGSVGRKA